MRISARSSSFLEVHQPAVFFLEWRCRSVNLLRKSNECTPFTEKNLQTSCNIQMSEHSRNRGCIVFISLRIKYFLQLPPCPPNNFVESVYSGTTNDVSYSNGRQLFGSPHIHSSFHTASSRAPLSL